jgi:hypothetical protein
MPVMDQRIEAAQSFVEEEEDDEEEDSPHLLQFRDSELNSTHNSRSDNFVAGGSNEERERQWIIYSSIALAVAAFVVVVLTSILVNRASIEV